MNRNKGFSLIEIILALAISVIVFVGIFHFTAVLYVGQERVEEEKYFSYAFGELYCLLGKTLENIQYNPEHIISFPNFSTSTKITSMHRIGSTVLLTTDSASTSESDIFLYSITDGTSTLVSSIDVGPGIQDSKLLDKFLYVANTSINSHMKVIYIQGNAFNPLMSLKLPQLAINGALPKKLSILNNQLILGSEKNNNQPEVLVMPIGGDGTVGNPTNSIELDGQMNQALVGYGDVFIANAADPELRAYDKTFNEIFTYDAPLTLGNGKSVLYMHPYLIFGRTLGSGELSLLYYTSTTTSVLDIKRTYGTVDYMQDIDEKYFLTFTANEDKELQFWSLENDKLKHQKDINLPGRVTSYACTQEKIYISILINEQPKLLWLEI